MLNAAVEHAGIASLIDAVIVKGQKMNRRKFLQTSGLGFAAISLTKFPSFAAELADQKKRVGLIGSGC